MHSPVIGNSVAGSCPSGRQRGEFQMKLIILLAMFIVISTVVMVYGAPVQAACDPFDRMGWACTKQNTVTKRTHTHQRAKYPRSMALGYARGVNPKLKSAFKYVRSRCKGVRAVSGVRKTYIGRGRRSLHWSGNALDFRSSSYRCAYAALRSYGWKGGWSRDGVRCRHIHISYGGGRREPRGFRHRRC